MDGFHVRAHNLPRPVRLGAEPTLAPTAIVLDVHFGRYCQVADHSRVQDCTIGDYSYLMQHCDAISADVGKFANIAAMVRINPGFHPTERPSLHHFTYRRAMYGMADADDESFFVWRRRMRVAIGHDTWVGHGAVIMPGVRIGNGSVIGSNSVVTRDVPPYTIVAGAPARVVRQRFAPAIAQAIEATAWWDWDHATLTARLEDFADMRRFLAKYAP